MIQGPCLLIHIFMRDNDILLNVISIVGIINYPSVLYQTWKKFVYFHDQTLEFSIISGEYQAKN